MFSVKVGSLVKSTSAFSGIGKIVSIDTEMLSAEVSFFSSPSRPNEGRITVPASQLFPILALPNKSVVFCKVGTQERWKLGFYEGERPGEKHLV